MAMLHGRAVTRADLARRTGGLASQGGVRLVALEDGPGRGMRVLEFRTGSGLAFEVLVDRAMDIGACEHRGRAIGWQSSTGVRAPGLHAAEGEGGLGFLRGFSGLLVTCGLDHAGFTAEEAAPHYNYGPRAAVRLPLHGRIGAEPARLGGYGEAWDGDRCVLWCEGTVRQSAVFGEDLHLHRRIEADLGGDEIRIHDRVVNAGFATTPHMLLYHLNVGFPLLDAGTRLVAPIRDTPAAAHAGGAYRRQGVGYRTMPEPRDGFAEQVWEHDLLADPDGRAPYAVVNDALGLGLTVEVDKAQLPCLTEWQHFAPGGYALGVEPGTNHLPGRAFARERGELIMLGHGEERRYDLTLRALDGAEALAEAERRIRAVGGQPEDEYPEPSGAFAKLR